MDKEKFDAAVNERLNATQSLMSRHSMSILQVPHLRRILQSRLDSHGIDGVPTADVDSQARPLSCSASLEASPIMTPHRMGMPAGSVAEMMQSELARAVAAAAAAPGQPHLPPMFNLGGRLSTTGGLGLTIAGSLGLTPPSAQTPPRSDGYSGAADTVGQKRKLPPLDCTPLALLSQSQCLADRRSWQQRSLPLSTEHLALQPSAPSTPAVLPAALPEVEPADLALTKPGSPLPLSSPAPLGGDAAIQQVTLLPYDAAPSVSTVSAPPPPRIANLKSGCEDGMLLLAATACLVARDDNKEAQARTAE